MSGINPVNIFRLLIFFFLVMGIAILVFMYIKGVGNAGGYLTLGTVCVFLLLLIIVLKYKLPVPARVLQKVEERKNKIISRSGELVIDYPLSEYRDRIAWETIEAIFLQYMPPLEGQYHYYEYFFVLNTAPVSEKYQQQRWYNRITTNRRPITGLPVVTINDYNNSDFDKISALIKENLRSTDAQWEICLTQQEGYRHESGNIRTVYFCRVFDRHRILNDVRLEKFRANCD